MRASTLALAAAAAAALAAGAGFATYQRLTGDAVARCITPGVIRGSDAFGGPFTLVDHTGATVTHEDVIAQPSLIYFGYTACPDICPMDAARNAGATDLLAEQGHEVRPVFISVDPARDTPEVLQDFADFMHPSMLGLTGSDAQVRAAAEAYRVAYSRGAGEDEFYLMNHSAFTYLEVPGEGVAAIFNPAMNPQTGQQGVTEETVAQATACILEAL